MQRVLIVLAACLVLIAAALAGSLTSQAYLERWSLKNELLADAAEKASVAAELLGALPYPMERLANAWALVMGGRFHDIHEYAWNDEILAMNQFAGVITSATEAVVSGMDTETEGTAIVVYNPLGIARQDVVEAAVPFPAAPKAVRVFGPAGVEVPAQLAEGGRVLFLANVPSAGYAVYDVQSAGAPGPIASKLAVTDSTLENERYLVKLDERGDVAGIYDKSIRRDLLAAPVRLAIGTIDSDDATRMPRTYVGADRIVPPPPNAPPGVALRPRIPADPPKVRIAEGGPVRVAIEVTRETEGSRFTETIRLAAGDAGNRVEFDNAIHWQTKDADLKVVFPLSPTATVLSGGKPASEENGENTLRLTLIRTPGTAVQDLGNHEILFGLAGHKGDWRQEQTDWQALRLNQPPIAFIASKHAGALGRTFSLVSVSTGRVRVMAVKKAGKGDEVIVRLVEADGLPQANVQVKFATPVVGAREVNGAEEPAGPATVAEGALMASFAKYQPRTFAVKLAPPAVKLSPVKSQPVKLAYDALPAGKLPATLTWGAVRFQLAPALAARGQSIELPPGHISRAYVLAAADGDQTATFRIGEKSVDLTVQNGGGFIGAPGYIKRADVGWFTARGAYEYLFVYPIDVPAGARTLTLPDNGRIRVVSISVADEPATVAPAQPLYDTLERSENAAKLARLLRQMLFRERVTFGGSLHLSK